MANREQTTMSHDAAQVRISALLLLLLLQDSSILHSTPLPSTWPSLSCAHRHTHGRHLFALKLAKKKKWASPLGAGRWILGARSWQHQLVSQIKDVQHVCLARWLLSDTPEREGGE